MKITVVRRLLLIRLALSLLFDYWRITRIDKRLQGMEREIAVKKIHKKAGIRMKKTANSLKGIIVKIGQFLSMRQDLLPRAFTDELQNLQDALPPSSPASVQGLIEKELSEKYRDIFREFDKNAIAAASLAQVHKAILKDGTIVAVKIIRPGMDKLARIDLGTIGLVARIVQKIPALNRKMNFIEMHQEFTETIHRELDCLQETKHMKRFDTMFSLNDQIKIPIVYEEFCSRRILIMEYIEGARVTDKQLLSKWQIDPVLVSETILDAYFKQLLVFGFIHVDPHPGNILILPDHRICFIDFGMIDELSVGEVQTLRSLFQSVMFRDLDGILSALEELGFLPRDTDPDELLPLLKKVIDRLDGAIQHQSSQEIKGLVAGMKYFVRDSPIQLQAKYMFLLRGTGMLITILSQLAPQTNWFEILFRVGPPTFSTPIKTESQNGDIR